MLGRPHRTQPLSQGLWPEAAARRQGTWPQGRRPGADDERRIAGSGARTGKERVHDLNFIKKAMFASRLVQGGHSRKLVSSALTCEKTVLSRWLPLTERVSAPLIEAIGPPPSANCDR